jgi:hypothetical protein
MYESTLRNSTSSVQTNNSNATSSTLNSIDDENINDDRILRSVEKRNIDRETLVDNEKNEDPSQITACINNEKENIEEISYNKDRKSANLSNISSLTNSFNKSKFKAKLAIWNETNILNEIPSPKVKMVYSGHRNTRTMVRNVYFLIYISFYLFYINLIF